jgi:hypothetical protein
MKKLLDRYTFDASLKKVSFSQYGTIVLGNILLITNITDNIIIYNFADTAKGGTVTGNILTLDYNTTAMDDTDQLQVFYDDPDSNQAMHGEMGGLISSEVTDHGVIRVLHEILDVLGEIRDRY